MMKKHYLEFGFQSEGKIALFYQTFMIVFED